MDCITEVRNERLRFRNNCFDAISCIRNYLLTKPDHRLVMTDEDYLKADEKITTCLFDPTNDCSYNEATIFVIALDNDNQIRISGDYIDAKNGVNGWADKCVISNINISDVLDFILLCENLKK